MFISPEVGCLHLVWNMTQAGGYELSRAIERLVSGLVPPFMMKVTIVL